MAKSTESRRLKVGLMLTPLMPVILLTIFQWIKMAQTISMGSVITFTIFSYFLVWTLGVLVYSEAKKRNCLSWICSITIGALSGLIVAPIIYTLFSFQGGNLFSRVLGVAITFGIVGAITSLVFWFLVLWKPRNSYQT